MLGRWPRRRPEYERSRWPGLARGKLGERQLNEHSGPGGRVDFEGQSDLAVELTEKKERRSERRNVQLAVQGPSLVKRVCQREITFSQRSHDREVRGVLEEELAQQLSLS